MSLILDKIIIDGVPFDYLPDSLVPIRQGAYGVHTETTPTLDGGNFGIVVSPIPLPDRPDYQFRKQNRQAWKAEWTTSFMDVDMKNFLETMYSLQKGFWLQMDDEMSFDLVNLLPFTDGQQQAFFTPTYPIAPYGFSPVNPVGYAGTIFVNGNPVDGGAVVVDSEVGMVRFDFPLTMYDQVQMRYTWKVMARVIECEITIDPESPAQGVYRGTVIFEQIKPNYGHNPWYSGLPDNDATMGSLATIITDASWQSVPSGFSAHSGWSEVSIATVGWTLITGVWGALGSGSSGSSGSSVPSTGRGGLLGF